MTVRVHGSVGIASRPVVVPVEESSQAGEARRAAVALAESLGFNETDQGRAALVVTEAATNLVKHARGGVIMLQAPTAGTFELLAIDAGPGMADTTRAMRDGVSTAGTSGKGLGAIARVADRFEIDSYPGHGTVVLAYLWAAKRPPPTPGPRLDIGAVCVPMHGERVCGDAWSIVEDDAFTTVLVADGLGHGVEAAKAAEAATRALIDAPAVTRTPADLLVRANGALRATRGAAVAVGTLDAIAGSMRFAGVGNVAATIVPTDTPVATRSLVSLNGIVGHQMRAPNELPYPWGPGTLLVLATDGVRTPWRLETLPGLARRHPAIVAATLWREYTRGRDDATVVVIRQTPV